MTDEVRDALTKRTADGGTEVVNAKASSYDMHIFIQSTNILYFSTRRNYMYVSLCKSMFPQFFVYVHISMSI
jgi:hypothetical protein